ncbi:MAG: hypothetical protein Ct9H90mP1_3000 [Methanobacteriota archaeon]|nr:MAG: hypothetical protein Ct9H90mP1_3000 [Euryarchaeota archaeon]
MGSRLGNLTRGSGCKRCWLSNRLARSKKRRSGPGKLWSPQPPRARDGVLYIFVSDEVRCDEFTLNVSVIEGDSDQKVWYTADWCTEDGKLPMGYADDPDGWLHMGDVRGLESGGSYEFVSEDNLIAVPEGFTLFLNLGGFCGRYLRSARRRIVRLLRTPDNASRTHPGIYDEGGGSKKLQGRRGGQDYSRPFRNRGQPGIHAELGWSWWARGRVVGRHGSWYKQN